jgi:TLD
MLFQLSPTHAVYKATPYHTQLAYFSPRLGLGFGVPPPQPTRRQSFSAQTLIQHTTDPQVSLSLDPSLELASFTHTPPGGTFAASVGAGTMGTGEFRWRVELAEVEVWGCGVEDAREEQRRAWEWERREAERRQNIRVREDLAGDRALLEMAGLIGGNRSGGSV